MRIALKIPLILAKNKRIVPTTLYKSNNLDNYKKSYKLAYEALIAVLKDIGVIDFSAPYENDEAKFLQFCMIHFPMSKVNFSSWILSIRSPILTWRPPLFA